MKPKQVLAAGASLLGEGPVWWDGELLWVDIYGQSINRLNLTSGTLRQIHTDGYVSAVVPRPDGAYLVATAKGFSLLDPVSGEFEMISEVEQHLPGNRMNDGKCDSMGRFWAGTQAEDLTPHRAGLYMLDLEGRVVKMIDGVSISNGMAWSPDDTLFYHVDTAEQGVDVFDYDEVSGAITNRRRLVTFAPRLGAPDGMAIDVEGNLWIAMWDGWSLIQVSPSGELLDKIQFPVRNVTSCAFGGEGLQSLYITTAAWDAFGPFDKERLLREPMAGCVFKITPAVAGLPLTPCRVLL